MASTTRSTASLSRQALRHCKTQNAVRTGPSGSTCARSFATSAPRLSEENPPVAPANPHAGAPRWSYTPEQMKAPFSINIPKTASPGIWKVNEDPKKLDWALENFLGHDGDRLLPEELKWLAVTHKSFDQARRGFNDRLGFLGRQICTMEAMKTIVIGRPPLKGAAPTDYYSGKRQPFKDPALRSLDNLCVRQPMDIFTLERLAKLAIDTGLAEVVRWKPRNIGNQLGSGLNPVMAGAVFAVIGAVALQNGGKVASKIAHSRVIKRLEQFMETEKLRKEKK